MNPWFTQTGNMTLVEQQAMLVYTMLGASTENYTKEPGGGGTHL